MPPEVQITVASTCWHARQPRIRIVGGGVVMACAGLIPLVLTGLGRLPHRPVSDYSVFYSFSRFIWISPAASVYDMQPLGQFQLALHGLRSPYLYDPCMLLLVWPLALLPFFAGWLCWIGIGLIGYATAIYSHGGSRAAVFAAIAAPSTLWTALCGQTALLGAALMFGGFRLLPRRPVPAGLLFGMLTYKPQLAVLVPVALLAASQWRCLLAMVVAACLFRVASALAFGVAAWSAWLHALPSLGREVGVVTAAFAPLMITVTGNLLRFGMPVAAAHAAQLLVAIAACMAVAFRARRGASALDAALVATATLLATPYAFAYDLPLLTAAVIAVAAERYACDDDFAGWEIAVLLGGFLLPVCIVIPALFRCSSLVVMALLWLIVRRIAVLDTRPRIVPSGSRAAA